MKKANKPISLSPLAQLAEKALKEAVREVIEDHERTGRPLAIWKNGRVAYVSAKSLKRK